MNTLKSPANSVPTIILTTPTVPITVLIAPTVPSTILMTPTVRHALAAGPRPFGSMSVKPEGRGLRLRGCVVELGYLWGKTAD